MNEGRFITRIHQKVKRHVPGLFFVKIKMLYVAGIPDCYYSGNGGDVWVEYKYLNSTPKRSEFQLSHEVTALQRDFLSGRQAEGRQVGLIVGTPDGAAIYVDREWESQRFKAPEKWLSDKEVIQWLVKRTISM